VSEPNTNPQLANNSKLENLLELKQMQANLSAARDTVKLARDSRKLAEASQKLAEDSQEQTLQGAKQNMTVMLFTAITIIFLPLSFVCGVFGMNAMELGQGGMPISTQFAIMSE